MSTKRFGEKLRTLRERQGMSQHELARILGFASPAFVGFLERGDCKPSTDLVLQGAHLFNVTTDHMT